MFSFNRSPVFWAVLGALWGLSAVLIGAAHRSVWGPCMLGLLALCCFALSLWFWKKG